MNNLIVLGSGQTRHKQHLYNWMEILFKINVIDIRGVK
jgi:hypothetical protein